MSGYTRLPTYNPDNSKYDSDADVSREISDQEDCASFADNEDKQDAPLLAMNHEQKGKKQDSSLANPTPAMKAIMKKMEEREKQKEQIIEEQMINASRNPIIDLAVEPNWTNKENRDIQIDNMTIFRTHNSELTPAMEEIIRRRANRLAVESDDSIALNQSDTSKTLDITDSPVKFYQSDIPTTFEQSDSPIILDRSDSDEEYGVGIIEKKKQPKFSEFLRHRRKTRNSRDRDAFVPEQFELKKRSIPWKAISYAVILFVVGTALLVAGSLIHIGHVDNEKYGDRLWPLMIFGALMFIPGSYHVYLAVNAFLGTPGYSFDDIPEFD